MSLLCVKVSPYRDTALVRTDIDLAREQPMDAARFKKTFLTEKVWLPFSAS